VKRSALRRKTRIARISEKQRLIREKSLDPAREAAFRRDGRRCRRCRSTSHLEAHHLRSRARGGAHHESNLVTLCRTCHRGVTYHEVDDWRDWTA